MSMVRKQIYLTAEQDDKVKRLAKALNVPEAEVIRRAIDGIVEYQSGGIERLAASETATIPYGVSAMDVNQRKNILRLKKGLDHQAWEEELAFIMERARAVGGSTEKFNREDVYDKRRMRLPD